MKNGGDISSTDGPPHSHPVDTHDLRARYPHCRACGSYFCRKCNAYGDHSSDEPHPRGGA